ncbi:hypothetical protein D3C83_66920 [compost metagenome]
MLARVPPIELGLDQHHRERSPVPAEGLGQAHDVWLDACALEREEWTGAPATDLDVVDDQQDAVAAGERVESL